MSDKAETSYVEGQQRAQVDALLREKAGYERRGLADRAKGVDAQLKALGQGDKPAGRRSASSETA